MLVHDRVAAITAADPLQGIHGMLVFSSRTSLVRNISDKSVVEFPCSMSLHYVNYWVCCVRMTQVERVLNEQVLAHRSTISLYLQSSIQAKYVLQIYVNWKTQSDPKSGKNRVIWFSIFILPQSVTSGGNVEVPAPTVPAIFTPDTIHLASQSRSMVP